MRNLENKLMNVKIPLIYHSRYDITACGIEKMHPFDAQKYGKVFHKLVERNFITNKRDIHEPGSILRSSLLLVNFLLIDKSNII